MARSEWLAFFYFCLVEFVAFDFDFAAVEPPLRNIKNNRKVKNENEKHPESKNNFELI